MLLPGWKSNIHTNSDSDANAVTDADDHADRDTDIFADSDADHGLDHSRYYSGWPFLFSRLSPLLN
jgi:hypothetical protein